MTGPTPMRTQTFPQTRRPIALLMVELFAGVTALAGGIGLVINGLGIPRDQLESTPFDTFLMPGLILSLVVGGSLLIAARMIWKRSPLAPLASLTAGCILLGWILVEAVMIDDGRVLQAVVFALALLTISLAWLLRRREADQARTDLEEARRTPSFNGDVLLER